MTQQKKSNDENTALSDQASPLPELNMRLLLFNRELPSEFFLIMAALGSYRKIQRMRPYVVGQIILTYYVWFVFHKGNELF